MKQSLLLAAISMLACTSSAQEPTVQSGAFIVEFTLSDDFQQWYNEHHDDSAMPDSSWVLALVYATPSAESDLLGSIETSTRWRSVGGSSSYLDAAVEFVPVETTDRNTWIDPVGDWGYGIITATQMVAGAWILLPSIVFGIDAWVLVESDGAGSALPGYVRSLQDELITIESGVHSLRGPLNPGSYFVASFNDSRVTVRRDVPSDMSCGDDVLAKPEKSGIPTYDIPVSALFGSGGLPRFRITYGKGC